jgi:hypothetical protein
MGLLHAIWMDIIGHGWLDQISMDRSMSETRDRFFTTVLINDSVLPPDQSL